MEQTESLVTGMDHPEKGPGKGNFRCAVSLRAGRSDRASFLLTVRQKSGSQTTWRGRNKATALISFEIQESTLTTGKGDVDPSLLLSWLKEPVDVVTLADAKQSGLPGCGALRFVLRVLLLRLRGVKCYFEQGLFCPARTLIIPVRNNN